MKFPVVLAQILVPRGTSLVQEGKRPWIVPSTWRQRMGKDTSSIVPAIQTLFIKVPVALKTLYSLDFFTAELQEGQSPRIQNKKVYENLEFRIVHLPFSFQGVFVFKGKKTSTNAGLILFAFDCNYCAHIHMGTYQNSYLGKQSLWFSWTFI